MKVDRALNQISEIYDHLAKTEVYRGYRSIPVAATGTLALIGGILQPLFVSSYDSHDSATAPVAYVVFWVSIAAVCLTLVGLSVVFYSRRAEAASRRMAWKVIAQFLPCLGAGAAVTVGLLGGDASRLTLLPGIWAALFGLGMFASRPYLPRAIGWVALFYVIAGGHLIWRAGDGTSLQPWGIAAVFAFGQFCASLVLYWNLERKDAVQNDERANEV